MLKNLILLNLIALALWSLNADAKGHGRVKPSLDVVTAVYKAAKEYGVDAQDLIRVAYTESKFKVNAIRVNKNHTIDYGVFQVNSVHWTTTCKDLDVMSLQGNARCAARILSRIKAKHGATDSHWIGRYHSKTQSKKIKYAELIALADVQ